MGEQLKSEKLPPYSEESEKALLGSLLLDATNVMPICEENELEDTDFYVPAHQTIWQAMCALSEHGGVIDSVTVSEELKNGNMLDRVGGNTYLDGLVDVCTTSAHALYYLQIIKAKSKTRSLINILRENLDKVYHAEDSEIDDMINTIQDGLFKTAKTMEEPMSLLGATNSLMKRWKESKSGTKPGLPCYILPANKFLGSFRYGQLYFVASVPKAGKTTYLEQQLKYWAFDMNVPVAGASLEMMMPDFVGRIFCEQADVSMFALDNGIGDNPNEPSRMKKVHEVAKQWFNEDMSQKIPLYVTDRRMNVTELCSWVRMMVKKHGIKAVGIDYLQILKMPANMSRFKEHEQVTMVVERLRDLARELNIIVLVMAQITKESRKALHGSEKYKPEVPTPDDIRGGSVIVDAAYAVIMMYEWPSEVEYDKEGKPKPELRFDVQIHRGGMTGWVPLEFIKPRQRIICKGVHYGDREQERYD